MVCDASVGVPVASVQGLLFAVGVESVGGAADGHASFGDVAAVGTVVSDGAFGAGGAVVSDGAFGADGAVVSDGAFGSLGVVESAGTFGTHGAKSVGACAAGVGESADALGLLVSQEG